MASGPIAVAQVRHRSVGLRPGSCFGAGQHGPCRRILEGHDYPDQRDLSWHASPWQLPWPLPEPAQSAARRVGGATVNQIGVEYATFLTLACQESMMTKEGVRASSGTVAGWSRVDPSRTPGISDRDDGHIPTRTPDSARTKSVCFRKTRDTLNTVTSCVCGFVSTSLDC